jgi:hypothetical protein
MADQQRPTRMPTTNHPLNAEPRPTFGPAVLTLILLVGIVGVLAWTLSATSPLGYLGDILP